MHLPGIRAAGSRDIHHGGVRHASVMTLMTIGLVFFRRAQQHGKVKNSMHSVRTIIVACHDVSPFRAARAMEPMVAFGQGPNERPRVCRRRHRIRRRGARARAGKEVTRSRVCSAPLLPPPARPHARPIAQEFEHTESTPQLNRLAFTSGRVLTGGGWQVSK